MSEKSKTDVRHVQFPQVRSFKSCREDLEKKLAEIDRAFEEIERRRTEMPQLPLRSDGQEQD